MSWLSHFAERAKRETIGHPIHLPPTLVHQHPCLNEAHWRVGGLPLRIGGWCLGQRSVAGITLGDTVFLAENATLDPRLLVHEVAHVRQFGQDKSFPIRYLWESLTKGYRNNRYELEADAFVQEVVWSKTPPRQS